MRSIVFFLAGLVFASVACAQQAAWPSRPVRVVIGLPPGSGSDLLARAFAQRLQGRWGQPVVVDNRPGANTIIATEAVAKAAPDGYTLLFGFDHSFTINPYLYSKLPYDPFRDFEPVALLTSFGMILAAHPSLEASTVPELVALAKREPGKLTYASIGSGSQMHLVMETLANRAGVRFTHVPYKGIPQMMTAVLTGEVQLTWVGVFSTRPLAAAKKVKPIAYSGAQRSPLMPDVPTFVEVGYPDVQIAVWYGLLAPAGTPQAVVERIHADVQAVMAEPDFREREMVAKGYEPSSLSPAAFGAMIRDEYTARAAMVKVSGAKAD